jgi:lycopene beta-cyclase
MTQYDYDVILAGGGLASSLTGYRLRQLKPNLRLLIIEAGPRLGGNHTWSFHETDISRDARAWVHPFVAHSWEKQAVYFPRFSRRLNVGYNTIFSATVHQAAMTLLEDSVMFGTRITDLDPHRVRLEDGRELSAACVIDARGQVAAPALAIGYQKFVGLEVRTAAPHGERYPVIMDATVPQRDGYRFVYTLPFSQDTLLIEDTYYSDTPDIDEPFLRDECLAYAGRKGWQVAEIIRVERGVLPIVLGGDLESLLSQNTPGVPALGLRAGFFHHTTSYSFPFAVRLADTISRLDNLTSEGLRDQIALWAQQHWQKQRFFRRLNRMLFWAAHPTMRYRVLERFYELRQSLIERFYSGELTFADQARILAGWPPVPISRALRVLGESTSNPIERVASWPS